MRNALLHNLTKERDFNKPHKRFHMRGGAILVLANKHAVVITLDLKIYPQEFL